MHVSDSKEHQEQRQTLPKRVTLKEDGYNANCSIVEMTPFDAIVERSEKWVNRARQ